MNTNETKAVAARHRADARTPSGTGQIQVGSLQIAYEDATCTLWLNKQKLSLSPTEYRLCACVLHQAGEGRSVQLPDGTQVIGWASQRALLHLVHGRRPHRALSRQLSNLNSKLAPHGLRLAPFEQSYGLLVEVEHVPIGVHPVGKGSIAQSTPLSAASYEAAQAPGGLGDMDTEALQRYGTALLQGMAELSAWTAGLTPLAQTSRGRLHTAPSADPPLHPESMSLVLEDVARLFLPGVTHTSAPGYLGADTTTISGPALLGAWLSSTLGLTGRWQGGDPGCKDLEQLVLRWLERLLCLSMPAQASLHPHADIATLLALHAARRATPRPPTERLRLYASAHAHPRLLTVARLLGLSERGLRWLPVNRHGSLQVRALEQALSQDQRAGWHPFAVVATLGTPTLGGCDPVSELAAICERAQLWLHVDASLYGAAAIDPTLSWVLDGAERATSLLLGLAPWCPMPHSGSVLWVRQPTLPLEPLQEERGTCALLLWMVLRYFGQVGLVRRLREYCRLAQLFAHWLDEVPEWERLTEPVLHSVCFRAHPTSITEPLALNTLNQQLAEIINAGGRFVIEEVVIDQLVALRVTIGNMRLLEEDLRLLWEQLTNALTRCMRVAPNQSTQRT